jgi:predicted DCC family thiol-disulfide oxidoreductase YuxK
VFTELSDSIDRKRVRGWVLYDATCALCQAQVSATQIPLEEGGFEVQPLQTPWVREVLNLPEDQLLAEMRVLTRKGKVLGGADALVFVASELRLRRRPWWAWALLVASKMPLGMPILRAAYRWFAAKRYCRQGVCQMPSPLNSNKEGVL